LIGWWLKIERYLRVLPYGNGLVAVKAQYQKLRLFDASCWQESIRIRISYKAGKANGGATANRCVIRNYVGARRGAAKWFGDQPWGRREGSVTECYKTFVEMNR